AAQLFHHGVDGVFELEDLAPHVHGDLLGEVPGGDGGGHLGDVAHLGGQVIRHQVDVDGEVLPGAGDAGHLGLAAELPFGAHLSRPPRHSCGVAAQLFHHGVDGVFELQDLAPDVHGDLARQVPRGDSGGDLGNVAHLGGEVARHQVDVDGEVLPGAG